MKKAKKKTTGRTAKRAAAKTAPKATTTSKTGTKKRRKGSKKGVDLTKVRENITRIVKGRVGKMVKAAATAAETGQLPQMRYLLEVSGIYPKAEGTEGTEAKPPEDNSLAQLLLKKLDIPEEPVIREEDDEANPVGKKRAAESSGSESAEEEKSESGETQGTGSAEKESGQEAVTAEAVPVE